MSSRRATRAGITTTRLCPTYPPPTRRPLRSPPSFSNYALTTGGKNHTIAAPGVCIYSTWLGSGYNTISGTSMATPHMTGAVALCLDDGGVAGPCAGLTPAQIVQKMRSDAYGHSLAVYGYGFTGDPFRPVSTRYYGYLDWAGTTPPPTLTHVAKFPATTTVTSGTLRGGSAASLTANDDVYYSVNSTTTATRTTAWYGTFTGVSKQLTNLKVTYRGKNSLTCTQTLALWDWTASGGAGGWVQFDSRSVGTSEVGVAVIPLGSVSKYVGGATADQLRFRVRCTRSSSSFYASGDLLRLDYDKP